MARLLPASLIVALALVPGVVVTAPAATALPPPHDVNGNVVVIVGDLVPNSDSDSLSNAIAVSNLTASLGPHKIIHAGDLQYECPTLALFNRDYHRVWGSQRDKIAPAIGNHEYCNGTEPDAPGYKGYFGSQAYPSGASYYAFNLNLPNGGHVRFLILNSNCLQWNKVSPGCGESQAMATFIKNDLAADNATCEVAVWHEPAFGSEVPYHGDGKDAMRTIWKVLDERGVDFVVAGHAHNYQRYQRMNYQGTETSSGMPSAIIGTGGRSLDDVTDFSWHGALAALDDTHFGVLRMGFTDSSHFNTSFRTTSGSSLDVTPFSCT